MENNIHPYFSKIDPERTWLYRLEMESFEDIDLKEIGLYAMSVKIPDSNTKTNTTSDMPIDFFADYRYNVLGFIEKWMRDWPKTATNGKIIMFTPKYEEYRSYSLWGVKPVSIFRPKLSWLSTDNLKFSTVFSVAGISLSSKNE